MKILCFLVLATFSLAFAQLRQSVTSSKFNEIDGHEGNDFQPLLESHPNVGDEVAQDEPSALGFLDGNMDISDLETMGGEDREMFMTRICQYIEGLFSYQMICVCTTDIKSLAIAYTCNRYEDIQRGNIRFTPNVFGSLVLKILNAKVSFGAGYCAEKFAVYVSDIATELNFGDFCVGGTVSVAALRVEPYIKFSIDACAVDFGTFGDCVCKTCTVRGLPGISTKCTTSLGGSQIINTPCVPLGIPLFRQSEPFDIDTMMDPFNLTEAINLKVAEYKREHQAGSQTNTDSSYTNGARPTLGLDGGNGNGNGDGGDAMGNDEEDTAPKRNKNQETGPGDNGGEQQPKRNKNQESGPGDNGGEQQPKRNKNQESGPGDNGGEEQPKRNKNQDSAPGEVDQGGNGPVISVASVNTGTNTAGSSGANTGVTATAQDVNGGQSDRPPKQASWTTYDRVKNFVFG